MQINFTPKKIQSAKVYIENLENFSKEKQKERKSKKEKKVSFLQKIKRLFRG